MIDVFLALAGVLIFGFVIVIPVYVRVFKEEMMKELEEQIRKKEEMKKLREEMKKSKKKGK